MVGLVGLLVLVGFVGLFVIVGLVGAVGAGWEWLVSQGGRGG